MWTIIIILVLWGMFSGGHPGHCRGCRRGFFSRYDCDHCYEGDGCGCLTWLIVIAVIWVLAK